MVVQHTQHLSLRLQLRGDSAVSPKTVARLRQPLEQIQYSMSQKLVFQVRFECLILPHRGTTVEGELPVAVEGHLGSFYDIQYQ